MLRIFLSVNFILGVIATTPAFAYDLKTSKWEDFYNRSSPYEETTDSFAKHYLRGVLSGIWWMNIEASGGSGVEIFCLKPEDTFSIEEAARILAEEKRLKSADIGEFPLALVMVMALKRTYPCT